MWWVKILITLDCLICYKSKCPLSHTSIGLIVRPIYKKLSNEFYFLTDPFGIKLDEETSLALDHLIITIDMVDHHLDEIELKEDRDTYARAVVDFLGSDPEDRDGTLSVELKVHLRFLRKHLEIKGSIDQFVSASKIIFKNTEAKRHATNYDLLHNQVMAEGRATGDLTLSIMDLSDDSKFGQFFISMCGLLGIADLIPDAKDDFRNGIINIKPTTFLYLQLLTTLIKHGLKVLFLFPRKLSFMRYCLRFVRYLSNRS